MTADGIPKFKKTKNWLKVVKKMIKLNSGVVYSFEKILILVKLTIAGTKKPKTPRNEFL